uniref:Alanine--tRNA ligase n=1 Tax=Fervidicoccus fontis TaxID=683846 RepID=A0A7J3ZJ51_9CREN
MGASEEEYRLDFFREKGFYRKTCSVCGRPFWTLDPDATICQDSPCTKYFFDRIPVRRPLSVSESRGEFLRFFEERGHRVIEPRPVVARWREDLYLTIASIVVFQPHVTSGIVPPPANPLVISQPSIRLEDIDSVGVTLGRHLTLFEMGGHHAFNSEREWIYWKDETVAYAFEFFTKTIGVPEGFLAFKESWWAGGGNAGPCFEVAAGGLEVATLVFMQYRVLNGGRLESIPLKIVDTGYGIERIAWFTQKTPTAFHAIYGSLVDRFRERVGLERPPRGYFEGLLHEAGSIDPDRPETIDAFVREISRISGEPEDRVRGVFDAETKLYSLLDHTKTLTFMLADGVVPSNQGEGYLARLVARRSLRNLVLLDSQTPLSELTAMQVDYWGRDFPHLKEHESYIIEVVELEERRFEELLKANLPRAIAMVRGDGSTETLKRVYTELGVPPELVAREARRQGIEVSVSRHFYSMIAREGSARPLAIPEEPEWLRGLPTTILVFHENPYARSTKARVLAVRGNIVVLDRTVAYPTGGGQACDAAWILDGSGRRLYVKQVEMIGSKVLHHLEESEAPALKVGDEVEVVIDWPRRYRLMRHHTATHIVLGALRAVLGFHVWQAGAEKTEEKARLDFTHHKPISREELERIEELANRIVLEDRPVKTRLVDRNEAEKRYGFSIYQGGAPLQPVLRIVEIEGHDVQACFGTHVAGTGDVGGIKVVSVSKIQDGVYRIEYVAGTEVSSYAAHLERKLDEIAEWVGGSREEVEKRVGSLVEEVRELRSTLSRYRSLVKKELLARILEGAEPLEGLRLYVYEDPIGDERLSTEALREAVERDKALVIARLAVQGGDTLVELSVGEEAARRASASTIVGELSRVLGGRGGGKPTHAYLRLGGPVSIERVREALRSLLTGSRE